MSYQPPPYPQQQYAPPPMAQPKKRSRGCLRWGLIALGVLIVLGIIASVATPKTAPSSTAVVVSGTSTTAPTAVLAAPPVASATTVLAAATFTVAPVIASTATEDLALSLEATVTAQAKLPPNARYAPPGCTSGVAYGSLCKDGSLSESTKGGACSSHGGVQQTLTCP